MEGLDDYCNQTVNISPVTAGASVEADAVSDPQTPGVRAEKTYTFDRFPAVLGLHLNRWCTARFFLFSSSSTEWVSTKIEGNLKLIGLFTLKSASQSTGNRV
jgi:hypothetical protein